MLNAIFTKVFGSRNERVVKRMGRVVDQVNALEESTKALSDDELKAKTAEFRERFKAGVTLDELLPEAFAVVREASVRKLGLRHFDVQLIGGIVLHNGMISEMKTGEGKTLMATLAGYLNALSGGSVHVVTVNDYLAARDADWMRPIYKALGMTVGVVVPGMDHEEKRAAYECDVVYATNNELGFDYLRDNMAFSVDQKVQRDHYFAIVDEVDSILIDEARTPLIISGPAEETPQLYVRINQLVPNLERAETPPEGSEEAPDGDFTIDEKQKQVYLTEEGMAKVESLMVKAGLLKPDDSLYNAHNLNLVHHLNASLRAHHLFHKDVDYIIKDNEIVIVDEFTGRTLAGRRWSDGLHQAVEAKENVPIQKENQTLASITFQNYFRLYEKLSGMTGTADTEAYEFQSDLRARSHRDTDAPADDPQGPRRSRFSQGGEQVQRHHRGHQGLRRAWPAGPGRHHVDRDIGADLRHAQATQDQARSAQRQATRAGGANRRPGGAGIRGHDRHQYGWPRYRYRPRR